MREGITALEQLGPTAGLALKVTTPMTEVGLNLARLELHNTDNWSGDVCNNEIHRKWCLATCVHLSTSDAMSSEVTSDGALNSDVVAERL